MKLIVSVLPSGEKYACYLNEKPMQGDTVLAIRKYLDLERKIVTKLVVGMLMSKTEKLVQTNSVVISPLNATNKTFLTYYGTVSKLYKELPAEANVRNGKVYTIEQIEAILNPYPPAVLKLVEILKSSSNDTWKDDSGEIHIDDVNVFETAERIFAALQNGEIIIEHKEIENEDINEGEEPVNAQETIQPESEGTIAVNIEDGGLWA